ncbi:MAG: hypothetical protein ABJB66_03555 [Gemmatimonadaceae bacterium]
MWCTLSIVGATACGREGVRVSRSATALSVALDTSRGAKIATLIVNGLSSAELNSIVTRDDSTWQQIIGVNVGAADAPPVVGHYSKNDSAIVFAPRFAFDAGRQYRVRVDAKQLSSSRTDSAQTFTVSLPAGDQTPHTGVARIFPGSDTLPENLLRWYIEFSGPMSRDGGLPYIKLLDDRNREVLHAFLPLDENFFNDDRTRYTAFLDPGRVKRGILPNELLGRAIRAGSNYSIVIDSTWHDASGLPLKSSFRKSFHVSAPDDSRIDLTQWKTSSPRAGTRDTLVISFPKPLDHGLLKRAIGVEVVNGAPFIGVADIARNETEWRFVPNADWTNNKYQVVVFSMLEDAAGNRIDRPFEVDMFDKVDKDATPARFYVPLTIRNQ